MVASEARLGYQRRPEGMASEQNQQSLSTIAADWSKTLWSAVRASDGEKGGPNQSFTDGGGIPLPAQAAMWAAPTASDGERGPDFAKLERSSTGLSIQAQAILWSAPTVADITGGRRARSGERSDELLLNGQVLDLSSRLDPKTSTRGEKSSSGGRVLNPLFTATLMGWPIGATAYGATETVSFHFKRRMRSELLRLGLPPEAPAPQPDLFG